MARPLAYEPKTNTQDRIRSPSTASSSRSSSSRESQDSLDRVRRDSLARSPKPTHKKSGSFNRLFGTKEPSLNSFKHLADLQQKELASKGQKLPFGVPQAKLPGSVKDDYKKAKERAKERAKMHDAIKEKMKQQEKDGYTTRRLSTSTNSFSSSELIDHNSNVPPSPRSPKMPPPSNGNRASWARHPASELDPLPEMPHSERHATLEVKPPTKSLSRESSKHDSGTLLSGRSRKEALPWE